MNWKVGKKVFATEEEAKNFSADLMSMGALGGWMPTEEQVTHRYVFGDFCKTEEVNNGTLSM